MSLPSQPGNVHFRGRPRSARPPRPSFNLEWDGAHQDDIDASDVDWLMSRDLRIVSVSDELRNRLPGEGALIASGDLADLIAESDRKPVLDLVHQIESGLRKSGVITFTLLVSPSPVRVTTVVTLSHHDQRPAVLMVFGPVDKDDTPLRDQTPQEEWAPSHGDEASFQFAIGNKSGLVSIGTSIFWMTGFSRDELLASPEIFNSLPHPADAPVQERIFLEPGSDPFDVKLRWTHRDGSERWVQLAGHPVTDAAGTITELRGSIRDITDQVNLQVMDRVRTAALRATANAVVISNAEGIIEWVNPAFTKLTGYDKNEVIGKQPNVLKSGAHKDDFYKDMWTTIMSGETWKGELVNKRKDGSTYDEEMTITPVRDFTGAITRFIAIKQDISKRKAQHAQLVLATKRAKEAASFKSNLLNNVSHEVMTPITAILSLSDIIREETSDELKEFAGEIHHHGARLRESLSNVLDLSRLQSKDFTLKPNWISPLEKLEMALERFTSLIDHDKVEMRITGTRDAVWLDEYSFERISVNLVSNAIRFTESGLITVDASLIDDELTLVVSDTGCGVEQAFIPKMFDEFRQESTGLNRQHPGNGLGLSVVKRLVRLCHGSVEVVSQKDLGTSVTVRLPNLPPADDQK